MNSVEKQDFFSLPDELAQKYEIKSCLKYTEQTATYLLCSRASGRPYLLKTAADPIFAGLLANEKSILEAVQQSPDTAFASRFPVPVYLGMHRLPNPADTDAANASDSEVTLYIRTYIEGSTLEELCETGYKKPGLAPARALDYIIALTELLHFLHTMNPPLIHRDIKPQNVVVDSEGNCHFIDFGISRFYQNKKRSDIFIMGTKLTAPPEQFGYQQTDIRSDLYSLGILLFYCVTGEYETNDHSLSELDPALAHIIRKATMFDPDKRYQTTSELLPDLLAARYPSTWQPGPHPAPKRLSLSHTLIISLLAMNLVLLCILGYVWLRLRPAVPLASSQPETYDMASPTADPEAGLPENTDKTNPLSETAEYHFTEPLIEEAVRTQLNLPEGAVTIRDLEKITELHIFGLMIYSSDNEIWFKGDAMWVYDDETREAGLYNQKGTISSLEDILYMPNLDTLCLYRQQISDISILKDTAITQIGLGYNPLTDLTPLENNASVTSLNLACLNIADTDVISTLPNLTSLNISSTKITSLKGLENCPIKELNLFGVMLSDYSELCSLPQLRDLTLNMLSEDILESIAGMEITDLEFPYSDALKLDALSALPGLETLYFHGNHFEPLQCESPQLDHLKSLDLVNVTIESFASLSSLKSLETLYTYGAVCEGYEGLDQIPNLQYINCTKEQYEEMNRMYPDSKFIYYY